MLNRIDPAMPSQAYKTYGVVSPPATHFRDATCQEVECLAYARGWRTTLDTATGLGARQANYIRLHSGRSFTAQQHGPGSSMVTFTFPPGQRCFAEHKVRLDRPEIFFVREGDWRGNPRGGDPVQLRPGDWVESFAEHQQRLDDTIRRG